MATVLELIKASKMPHFQIAIAANFRFRGFISRLSVHGNFYVNRLAGLVLCLVCSPSRLGSTGPLATELEEQCLLSRLDECHLGWRVV
ncbi:hypothetical protein ElyMa_004921100 [Elysia marginata]|uniref:Uncharacterized protein n=1 Tax=Elysia marginata TaxID=1093978 RepID=A0AAV4IZD3_9GAST|nr:hypothetical protein ElyMa_004921100 [Elysia marginata]